MRKRRPLTFLILVVAASTIRPLVRPADCGAWAFELVVGLCGAVILVLACNRLRFPHLINGDCHHLPIFQGWRGETLLRGRLHMSWSCKP